MSTRILFLAANVQPFLASGIATLLQEYNVTVLLLCNQDNPDAPLLPEPHPQLKVLQYDRKPDASLAAEVFDFKPDLVYCAGWMHTRYLEWCYRLRKREVVTICAMDTQWKGTWKQRLLSMLSPLLSGFVFSHAWVPGSRQEQYARKLGFNAACIIDSLYAPDTALWAGVYTRKENTAEATAIKEFLYIGRLEPHKLKNLLLAFRRLSPEERQGWQLRLIGRGSMLHDPLLQHEAIHVLDFMPQQELVAAIAATAAGCLCSSDEPWGTVIQEMAAAGLPLIVSRQCGAQPHFVTDKENGFVCDGTDPGSIRKALLQMIACDGATRAEMGKISHQRGTSSNSHTWAASLMSLAAK